MKYLKLLFVVTVVLIISSSCKQTSKLNKTTKVYELTDEIRQNLIGKVSKMADLDQKYRTAISLGTLDSESLKKDKEMRKTATMEEYIAFTKTINKTLNEDEIDSLWVLQHKLDYKNYQDLKSIVEKYGYPSEQRLKIESDKLFPILLHPPKELEPNSYLIEMMKLLKPEVLEGRMDSNKYATFVDNIKSKILNEPQLYGTNKSFNPKTMTMGLPIIKDLKETNKMRKEIGLSELKEGEFELSNKEN